jgi:hypothetical protein
MTKKDSSKKGATKGKPDIEAETVKQTAHAFGAELYKMALTAVYGAPEALAVAERCREIYEAEEDKGGEKYFIERVDAVTSESSDNLMLASPGEPLFPLVYARAAAEWKREPEPNVYTRLLDIIRRVDAGESLAEMYAECERRHAEWKAEREAEELAKPEPKDKTSAEWRWWKLRQVEADLDSGDTERYGAAWGYFRNLLLWLIADSNFWHVSTVHRLLASLMVIRQELDGMERRERRSDAGVKGAQTRKRNAAKKGGAKRKAA